MFTRVTVLWLRGADRSFVKHKGYMKIRKARNYDELGMENERYTLVVWTLSSRQRLDSIL